MNDLTKKEQTDLIEARVKEITKRIKGKVASHSDEDYEYARSTIYDVVEKAQELLETSVQVAKETESPRSIEVATSLAKTIVDSSKDLISLQDQLVDLTDKISKGSSAKERGASDYQGGSQGGVNISMTTTELMEMIDNAKNPPVEVEEVAEDADFDEDKPSK